MPDCNSAAIIGMGCLFPKSPGLKKYWQLLFHGKDAISEVPESHWSPQEYFDSDQKRPDHVYCTRGGFLAPIEFDPTEFGIPPNSLEATDTSQLLGLLAAKMALEDSGYGEERNFNRDRTSVILGVTGTQELVVPLSSRLGHPIWRKALRESTLPSDKIEAVIRQIADSYVPWQENSFPGLLGNVVAGRICNRLDLRGTNCVVDAACASSLSAVHLALLELQSGRSDMVITGGVDTLNDIFMHMCFSKTQALSATGDARPFSQDADGTVLGEGIGMLVLKRLNQAESDNDRIYAVIKGLGTSSDGKSQSIYSPRREGQVKALRAAYHTAGISPASVQLVEAHGTGTRVGDKVEFEALNRIFKEPGSNGNKCALGSVKSMIGHTKASAGAAGLIKAALGLYHKVLPPTLKANPPDPGLDIENSQFYLNTTTRPWFSANGDPRRAGVSAFGFGGSNFHVVLEEYQRDKSEIAWDGSTEIIALSARQPVDLIQSVVKFRKALADGIGEKEFSIKTAESRRDFSVDHPHRVLMVCENFPDKMDLFDRALRALESEANPASLNLRNIYISSSRKPGALAFVFPGQGSQYLAMGRDIVCTFPQAMQVMVDADQQVQRSTRLSDIIFPAPAHTRQELSKQQAMLQRTDHAQPAIGAISLAMLSVLNEFGITPTATGGHSFGELTALCAAGWISKTDLIQLAVIRGQLMAAADGNLQPPQGAMLAVQAPLAKIEKIMADCHPQVVLANRNSPVQGVISGPAAAIAQIETICKDRRIRTTRLPVSAAFHSQQMNPAVQPFLKALGEISITPTNVDVLSNTTGGAYPVDPPAVRKLLSEQLNHPVNFVREIENFYNTGIRTFVEIGPKSILSGLISATLGKRGCETVALDASAGKTHGLGDLARLLCRLAALGYPVLLSKWEKPPTSNRPRRMKVLLSGTNYRNQMTENREQGTEDSAQKAEDSGRKTVNRRLETKISQRRTEPNRGPHRQDQKQTNQLFNNTDKDQQNDTMEKENSKQSGIIRDAYQVVAEGLKSMQRLQSQTAEAHQKFLESQTEANRALQEMMKNTQRLAERTLGIQTEINARESALKKGGEPQSMLPAVEKDPVPDPIATNLSPDSPSAQPTNATAPPSPTDTSMPHAAANGYATDEQTSQSRFDSSQESANGSSEIETTMLEIVSRLTGYPQEMLGLDMDIEAELGIDSIKRVEILSALEEKMPDLPTVSPDMLGSLNTLGQIAALISAGEERDEKNENRPQPTTSEEYPSAVAPDVVAVDTHHDQLTAIMLEVVSQLTGYPLEMLGLDMDIEAELGIDSIKRVEILSALEEKMPDLPAVSPDVLGALKTLGQIADYFSNPLTVDSAAKPSGELKTQVSAEVSDNSPAALSHPEPISADSDAVAIPRKIVTVVEAPPISETIIPISRSKKVFVTEDHTGLSEEITEELSKLNIKTIKISLDILKYKKQLPHAAGLIIVQNPRSENMDQDLKDAFHLAKYLAADLIAAANEGGAIFTTVTRLDGAFGLRGGHMEFPTQGGLAGLAKTAAIEWKNVGCHAIDVEPDWSNNREIASAVVKEILTTGPIEIGLQGGKRWTLSLETELLPKDFANQDQHHVIVVSGGARGVTAAAAFELAKHTDTTLVLLGRSPQPFTEPAWLSSLDAEAEIKAAIYKNESDGKTALPTLIEKKYQRYLANREIADNLRKLKSTGSNVTYYSVDVRNYNDVQGVLNEIRTLHGRIDGIIHAAGVLEDRLIIDKTTAQFERVYNTKVSGLKNLLEATRRDSLKFLVIFSSVAARLGNKGQSDYAMANEVLNKIAQVESVKRSDCRVLSINWGPWDGGMVTPALKREFERNGIQLIPIEHGAQCLRQEMMVATTGPVEIVIGAEPKRSNDINRHKPSRVELVKSVPAKPAIQKRQLALSFEREIDVQQHPILNSHMIDGKPVVPLALMTEWLAHGALHENPGLILHGLDDIRVLKGIRMEQDKSLIRLLAGKLTKNNKFYEVAVELRGVKSNGADILHSKAKAILSENLVAAPTHQFSKSMVAKAYPRPLEEVYDKILFHGLQLHGIRKVVSCASQGMVAHISTAPAPAEWMNSPLRNQWIADPLALDSAFQMATVWCFEEKGAVSLPSYVASYRQYRDQFPADAITVELEITEVTSRKMQGDFTFLDSENEMVARLTGYKAIMDTSLFKAFKPQYRASA